jgi:hypothetical protein
MLQIIDTHAHLFSVPISNNTDISVPREATNDYKNLFHCFYPAADPAVKRIKESIKSPVNLVEALTYAVAYLDQGVSVSHAGQQVSFTRQKTHRPRHIIDGVLEI